MFKGRELIDGDTIHSILDDELIGLAKFHVIIIANQPEPAPVQPEEVPEPAPAPQPAKPLTREEIVSLICLIFFSWSLRSI